MKTLKSRRVLSVLLSALMLMGLITPALSIPVSAEGSNLIAEYFSTDSEWYDAVTGSNQLDWQGGDYTSYQNGFHYFNGSAYLKILTQNLFSGVSESTGISFSYQWKPDQSDAHRHIISLGTNDVSNVASSFYITATTSWMSNNKAPFVGYVRADGNTQTIGAYPLNAPDFALGTSYDITVVVSVGEGVIFYINGIRYEASYYNSNFSDQQVYIREFLNAVSGWNNNYIGVSRWPDGNIKGWLKDLCIYNTALSAMDLFGNDAYDIYTSSYADSNLTADLTQTDAKNQFSAEAYHQGVETTGAYNNLVYSPIWTTSWSGNGVGDTPTGVGRTDFKVAIPRNVVMVYDGVTGHEPYAPITLETRCNDTNGSSHIIHYADYNNDISVFELKNEFWQGYGNTWDVWAKDHIYATEQFAAYWHDGGAPGESPDTQRDSASRFWWNMIKYYGTGNTSLYYDHESNFKFDAKTSYKTTSRQYKYGTFTSLTDFYTINYEPVYDALPSALECYTEITANGWMYTDESLKRAKATIAQMVMSNPNNTDYTYGADTNAAVQNCAVNIGKAVALLGAAGGTYGYEGLNLVKKTGVAVFNYDNGTELSRSAVVNYGDTFTVPAVPAKDYDNQYHYTNPVWDPAATPGSAVMSDDYNKTFTASYTQVEHTYTGSPTWGEWTDANTVVATFTCDNCGHTITPQVTVNSSPTGPTCTEAGYTVYTATVSNNGATYTNPTTKTVAGDPALEHRYTGTPTWGDWTDDNKVVATFKCDRCDNTITPEVTVTPAVTGPTCTEAGFTVYTATVTNNETTYTNPTTKTVAGDPALNHSYTGTPTWGDWTDDNKVVATFKCDRCDNTITPEVTVTPAVTDPTCTEAGYTVYTATVSNNGTTYTNPTTKTVPGDPALDHIYTGNPTWGNWTDDNKVVATFKCDRCDNTITPEVTITPAVTGPTCTEAGYTVYTATVANNGATYTNPTTKTVAGEAASGHRYRLEDTKTEARKSVATCNAPAVYYYSCEVCGEVEHDDAHTFTSGSVDLTNHSTTATELLRYKAPGYTFTGYTGDTCCAACHSVITPGSDIARLDIDENAVVAAAKDASEEAAANPDMYDEAAVTALNNKLADLDAALAVDDNDDTVIAIINDLEQIVTNMGASVLYTLTVDADNGTTATEVRGIANSTTDLGTPEKEGYIFKEWTVTAGSVNGTIYTFSDSNATATAVYTVKTSDAISGAQAILNDTAHYVDDYLTGLQSKLDELAAVDTTDPANNAEVKAIVDAINVLVSQADNNRAWTVTFKVDGAIVKTEKVKEGDSAAAPEQAEYITGAENHKKFSGWSGSYENVAADTEITASYQTEDHDWVDGGITLVPTCSETGTQAQSCVCGATNEKTLNKDSDNHADYGTTVVNAVTAQCNLDGYTGDTVCARCHAVLEEGETIAKETVAHNYEKADVKDAALKSEATCTSAAVYYYSCEVCGTVEANDEHTFTDGDPIAHTFTKADVKADALKSEATCTAPAVYYYSCDVCGEVENNDAHTFTDGEPIAHDYTKAEVKEAALKNASTCTAPAEYYYSCVMCGIVESNDEHTFTDGDALGHDWGSGEVTTPATYDTEGVRTYTCSRCGDTKTSAIPKLDSVSDATTVKDIVKADYLYSLDTDARVYYSPNSGVTSTDILAAEISHRNNYVEYSIAILDSGGNGKALSDAVWVAVPLDPTYYGQDTFDVFIVTEDGEQPVDVFYVNGGYVYIKTTTCGTFRVRNTEPSAHDGYRCSFCNTYDSVVNNPNSFFLYRFIITMIHFIIHAFSSLFRF